MATRRGFSAVPGELVIAKRKVWRARSQPRGEQRRADCVAAGGEPSIIGADVPARHPLQGAHVGMAERAAIIPPRWNVSLSSTWARTPSDSSYTGTSAA